MNKIAIGAVQKDFNPLIPNGMRLLTIGLLHRKYGNFNPLIPNGMRLSNRIEGDAKY